MRVPRYIEKALANRANYARRFFDCDTLISEWCEAKHIKLKECDCWGGSASLCDPEESSKRVLEAIENKR